MKSKKKETGYFTDSRDGKRYKWVRIGDQVWMAENLAYKASSGCWAYDNKSSNVAEYGYLYDWETANNVCPEGWHLPTKKELETLIEYFGDDSRAYEALKVEGSSGFDTKLGGWRDTNCQFYTRGSDAGFWATDDCYGSHEYNLWVAPSIGQAYIHFLPKTEGLSVRAIKDTQ